MPKTAVCPISALPLNDKWGLGDEWNKRGLSPIFYFLRVATLHNQHVMAMGRVVIANYLIFDILRP